MFEPGHVVEDTVIMTEGPQQSIPIVSVETDENGTMRRAEPTMNRMVNKATTRTVIPSLSDAMSLDGMGPYPGGYRSAGGPGREYPTATVPRNYQYNPASDAYSSLSRGSHMDPRHRPMDGYRTLDPAYRVPSRQQLDPYAAQPQVRVGSSMELSGMQRFVAEPYGLEDDQRSLGYDDPDYSMGPPIHYGTAPRLGKGTPRRVGSYEVLDGDMYYWGAGAPLAQGERGSMASLDSTLRKAPPTSWRQPELPEVIAMLNYRLDPVRSNAAAYLQHLTFKNDKVKSDTRRLKGIPALVSMLDSSNREVHCSAAGALKNISYGRDSDNKIAIKNCDGVPALVRLLRKIRDQELTDIITGTLWNLSSHDSVKMEIVDHALHALSDEVLVPHSGWERGGEAAASGREENCKPRHLEWETALTNTVGCLRNVSSERSEARRKLRECTGLVDALMYIVQSQIDRKDVDNKLIENSVCLLRNLSYQVHREIPGHERYLEVAPMQQGGAPGSSQKASCFGSRKGKDEWFSKGRKDTEKSAEDVIDFPKRATPAKGYEQLFQPEVVRLYIPLLKESKNPAVLEAAAGALQNLCAGRWAYGRYIRAMVRLEKGLPIMTELLSHGSDRVVRAMSGAMRNLSLDARNRELLGRHAVPNLVANLPAGGQQQPARALSEDTVVSVLGTLAEVMSSGVEAAKSLRAAQGIERLVLINKDGNRSEREVRGAGQVLQIVWGFKELRRPLEKDGWKKTDFMVNPNPPGTKRSNGGHDDSTHPLIDRSERQERDADMIPLDDLGPEGYSTLDDRARRNTMDSMDILDKDAIQGGLQEDPKSPMPLVDSYDAHTHRLTLCTNRRDHPIPTR
ncbi:catenin delta-1-like isoform X1 [Paramormyrops kingsleyae]|uniref:catenin delta-1-like isoform X1 n=1 Tax=Paramormyrops kingsleyae TaxID=1676925 RepID=UPI003B973BA4